MDMAEAIEEEFILCTFDSSDSEDGEIKVASPLCPHLNPVFLGRLRA